MMALNEWSESLLIAELSDEPSFSDDMEAVGRRLGRTEEPIDVILDLSRVGYLNSSNISQLLKARRQVLNLGGNIRVCGANDAVWSLMLITGLDKVFEFTDDVATSIASLQIATEFEDDGEA